MNKVYVLLAIALVSFCGGCGWATPASKHNSLTGVSESGYPKGDPADAGSPAMGTAQRPEKDKKPVETK